MKFLVFICIFISSAFSNSLQDAIDNAPPYSSIKLSEGIYVGNIFINKPLTIIGKKDTTIKGSQNGSVITINSSNVTLKYLTITKSGSRMDRLDAGISIKNAKNLKILGCKLIDNLYGIDMVMVEDSIIKDNYITSKDLDISLKGNGLKIYYSHNNLFKNNTINKVRDVTLNYSNNNTFIGNTFTNNRYATHLSLSHNTKFIKNTYKYNSVSIMLMGAKDTNITDNTIESSKGAAGIGVVISGVSNFHLTHNKIRFNAKAIYIDAKEKAKGMKRYISHNTISHNKEAFHFHVAIKDNTITHNKIYANIDDVVKDIDGLFSKTNVVEYNYWDMYSGFDRNKDGIGDNPHQIYQYASQLWQYNHKIKFFYATPMMTLLDFLTQLAPFIEPKLLLVDSYPIYKD
ncbi:MAG: nitrous oxide reductase family maturation protein NosD [Epsilonproteobacteria bacterium]|nr:nitrous oxide reductase family maturation protein NosD [Campylobacterota bacterium]